MAARHPVDGVARDGLPESDEEDGLIGRAVANEVKQHVDGRRPEDLGSEFVAEDFYKVFFRDVEIGEFDVEALRFRPVLILR